MCSVLQCAVVCCSVLQCAVVCCSVLQCVECVAVCCSVLHVFISVYSRSALVHFLVYVRASVQLCVRVGLCMCLFVHTHTCVHGGHMFVRKNVHAHVVKRCVCVALCVLH